MQLELTCLPMHPFIQEILRVSMPSPGLNTWDAVERHNTGLKEIPV